MRPGNKTASPRGQIPFALCTEYAIHHTFRSSSSNAESAIFPLCTAFITADQSAPENKFPIKDDP